MPEITHRSRTVLLVDDDLEIQTDLQERFAREGWRVIIEKDGEWALRSFERRRIDAVVLDILIPVLSGFQVAEKIRAMPTGAKVGMVMITGIYRGTRHRSLGIERYDLLDYLEKPLETERLVNLLREHFATLPPVTEPNEHPRKRDEIDEVQTQEPRAVEEMVAAPAPLVAKMPISGANPKATTSSGLPIRGNLKNVPFTQILAGLYRERGQGGLFLLRNKIKKIVYFKDGQPMYIKSNVLSECLGRVLVSQRMITNEECDESVRLMKEGRRQQGAVLMEMRLISPHNLHFGLEQQLQHKLFDVFHWPDGEYEYRDNFQLPDDTIALDMANAQIILEGLRRSGAEPRLRTLLPPQL